MADYEELGFDYRLLIDEPGTVGVRPYPDTTHGVFVLEVLPDSIASRFGVNAGDQILAFNQAGIRSVEDLKKAMSDVRPWVIVFARYLASEKQRNLTADKIGAWGAGAPPPTSPDVIEYFF